MELNQHIRTLKIGIDNITHNVWLGDTNCIIIVVNMSITYCIIGFNDYIIENRILYRNAYTTKSNSCKYQYRAKRKINKISNNGVIGYNLVKHGKRKFHSLERLRHRLKKCN